jgi:alpha-2-macroglobulin
MKDASGRDPRASGRRKRLLRLALAGLILAGASRSLFARQGNTDSSESFFAVSSRQTYSPSQQPRVSIEFRQIDHLDFRVYRVKDPIQFFSKLRDAHSFGSEKQELAREKTWLEEFHDWKR